MAGYEHTPEELEGTIGGENGRPRNYKMVSMDAVRAAVDAALAPFYEGVSTGVSIEDIDTAICHEINKL